MAGSKGETEDSSSLPLAPSSSVAAVRHLVPVVIRLVRTFDFNTDVISLALGQLG